jgi:hypothetical protein
MQGKIMTQRQQTDRLKTSQFGYLGTPVTNQNWIQEGKYKIKNAHNYHFACGAEWV